MNICKAKMHDCLNAFVKEWNDISPKEAKRVLIHTLSVYRLCKLIIRNLPVDIRIDYELLFKAAILHDIAKCRFPNFHNTKAEIIIDLYFDCDKSKKCRKYAKRLFSVIAAHKGEFAPKKCVQYEAAILRTADKIDKYRKAKNSSDLKKARRKYEHSKKLIQKHFIKSVDFVFLRYLFDNCDRLICNY